MAQSLGSTHQRLRAVLRNRFVRWGMWASAGFAVILAIPVLRYYPSVQQCAKLQPTEPSDAVIVLGAAVYGDEPGPVYAARLDHAVALFRDGFARAIITTGRAPESEIARQYVLSKGIPADAVIAEDRSTTTIENLAFSKEIMRARGWETAIISSCPFHLFRALEICRDLGLPAQGAAASSPIDWYFSSRIIYRVMECWKYPRYKWFGK